MTHSDDVNNKANTTTDAGDSSKRSVLNNILSKIRSKNSASETNGSILSKPGVLTPQSQSKVTNSKTEKLDEPIVGEARLKIFDGYTKNMLRGSIEIIG